MRKLKKALSLILALALSLTLAIPVFADGKTALAYIAYPAENKLMLNGELVEDATVYTINGYNYFKLRDVAALLNGTEKQFSVDYEPGKGIMLTTGEGYDKLDTDLLGPATEYGSATTTYYIDLWIDGKEGESYTEPGGKTWTWTYSYFIGNDLYNIGGYNYFKLRDLASFLDFYVGYVDGVVEIDTSRSYES